MRTVGLVEESGGIPSGLPLAVIAPRGSGFDRGLLVDLIVRVCRLRTAASVDFPGGRSHGNDRRGEQETTFPSAVACLQIL